MPCTSPNQIFYLGINPETGKKLTFFTSRHATHIYRGKNMRSWTPSTFDPDVSRKLGYEVITDSDRVPCGQCIGCRMDYARQWACRMMVESKKYMPSELWFLTCTYDDEHLPPVREVVDKVTGTYVPSQFHSVSKRDHQLFMKRLRKEYGDGIRFFCSGEYGDTSYRPHLHYILYGLKLDDVVQVGHNWRGETYYDSPKLAKIWNKGSITLGHLDFDSCEYVARYTLKKHKGLDDWIYEDLGIDPEFCCMSRRPGIGKEWIEENIDKAYRYDKIVLPTFEGSFETIPPKYFDSILERLDPDRYEQVKQIRREKAEEADITYKVMHPFQDPEELLAAKARRDKYSVINKKKGVL